jgi:hypothetical protein
MIVGQESRVLGVAGAFERWGFLGARGAAIPVASAIAGQRSIKRASPWHKFDPSSSVELFVRAVFGLSDPANPLLAIA